jgi:hypothetical protein
MKGRHRSRTRKQHFASPKRPVRRALGDPSDPPDIEGHAQRVFEPLMTPHEAETGMSFIITKAQKAELRRRGYSEEQIREMKPGDAHRALGLIG